MTDRVSQPSKEVAVAALRVAGALAARRLSRSVPLLVMLGFALATLALPRPAAAWRQGWAFGPGAWVAMPPGPAPFLFPGVRPLPGYRFAFPPGAPLTYSDPGSGITYCLSQPTGFYYECGYSPSAGYAVQPLYPIPTGAPPPPPDQPVPQASGVFLFRLPQGAEVAVDDVPIDLSEGVGIIAVTPGRHRVALRVSGKETEHAINVIPHKILTITPTAIVATEP